MWFFKTSFHIAYTVKFVSAVLRKKSGGKHLTTRKHGSACGDIVVEKVGKKQCCNCRGHKVLEMFKGYNSACNGGPCS